ncbi:hypothetical protein ACVWW4_004034 [Bradyrhizobium sp. LB7.1]
MLSNPALVSAPSEKIVLQRQLADLVVQRLHVDGGFGDPTPAAQTENIGSAAFELGLSTM